MDCSRSMIYFSTYENGVKSKRAGYAAVFIRGGICDVQIYYRGAVENEENSLQPVYVFRDGTVILGNEMPVEEGMATTMLRTTRRDFMQSGRAYEELETVYLDGVKEGICGGRVDGKELDAVWEKKSPEPLQEAPAEAETIKQQEYWSLQECIEHFPEVKLPPDGIRRNCYRISLEDLEHLPEEWQMLKNNHFLLHGYYEYHHLLFAKLACRYGERYAVGVPGEFCYRNQYMAENFGFYDFAPLEPGKRRGGSFGYWYFYLD